MHVFWLQGAPYLLIDLFTQPALGQQGVFIFTFLPWGCDCFMLSHAVCHVHDYSADKGEQIVFADVAENNVFDASCDWRDVHMELSVVMLELRLGCGEGVRCGLASLDHRWRDDVQTVSAGGLNAAGKGGGLELFQVVLGRVHIRGDEDGAHRSS